MTAVDFSSLSLSKPMLNTLQNLGFTQPTPIQEQTIPALLKGVDLMAQSHTGSGKTAAFAIPILEKIVLTNTQPQALILCPTRELCAQVAQEIRRLGSHLAGLYVLVIAGGQPIKPQKEALEKGAPILVGTPGRVMDHLQRNSLSLDTLTTLVLDEADRMLDMGFHDDIKEIFSFTPKKKQTLFFSATYPEEIKELSQIFQRNSVHVTVDEDALQPAILQECYEVASADLKLNALLLLLKKVRPKSALIFCNFKAAVGELTEKLRFLGVDAECIYGDMEQTDRNRVIAKFRNQSIRVLVATDVVARGIDIDHLDLVVNFDIPVTPDVYTHRIGRTGRAGEKGVAVTIALQREKNKIQNMIETLDIQLTQKSFPQSELQAVSLTKNSLSLDAPMATLFLFAGKKDKLRPADILGALTGEGIELNASDIGKIEIHPNFSYVALNKSVAKEALHKLKTGKIKGRKVRVELAH